MRAMSLLLVTIVTLTRTGAGSHTAPERLWTYDAEAEVTSIGAINSGDLIVTTKARAFLLGSAGGTVGWSTTDLRDCTPMGSYLECRYLDRKAETVLFPDSTYVRIFFDDSLVVLNLVSGEKVFDSADHDLGKIERHRAVADAGWLLLFSERGRDRLVSGVKLDGGAATLWTSTVGTTRDFRWLGEPADGSTLVYGKNAAGARVVTAIDIESGAVRWSRSDLLQKDVPSPPNETPPPFIDGSGGLILFVSKDGPMRLGPGGEPVWRATELAGKDPSAIVAAAGMLYVHQGGRIVGVKASDGKVVWQHDPKTHLYGFEAHGRGLLVWTQKNELNYIDLASGTPLWQAPAKIPEGWSSAWYSLVEPYYSSAQAVAIHEDAVFVAGRKELARVAIGDGSVTTIAVYEFGDGQAPELAELVEGAIVLQSSQNVARFQFDGTRAFHRYRPAPRMGRLARLAQLAAAASVAQGGGIPAGPGRYEKSYTVDGFVYMYFENPDGGDEHRYGLVRIDKVTGEETEPLWINEREPGYGLLPGTLNVYFTTGGRLIHAARF